jgi:hypothetical protein
MLRKIIETKVIASTGGAGAGVVLSPFILWLLGVIVWHVPSDAAHAIAAVAAVPTPVVGIVGIIAIPGITFLSGYRAPHTDRTPAPAAPDAAPAIVDAAPAIVDAIKPEPSPAPAPVAPPATEAVPQLPAAPVLPV